MSALHPLAKGVEHPAPLRGNASSLLVVAGLFIAPAAWALQLLVSYGLNGDACGGSKSWESGRSPLDVAIGVIAVVACLLGLCAAHRTWRLTRHEGPGDHHEGLTAGLGRTRFLALCGIVGSSIFSVASIFELLVPFLVVPCLSRLL
jgi:hypothetical protein